LGDWSEEKEQIRGRGPEKALDRLEIRVKIRWPKKDFIPRNVNETVRALTLRVRGDSGLE